MAFISLRFNLRFFLVLEITMMTGTFGWINHLSNEDFYHDTCPKALSTIKWMVNRAIDAEKRMAASLVRLHFHDCFVNGCDASLLLDKVKNSELKEPPNKNSLRGMDVIDKIKEAVDAKCPNANVSCADILAIAARDSIARHGGPPYTLYLGRKDSSKPYGPQVVPNIPSPFMKREALKSIFRSKGLDEKDLVALSGAHTLGKATCRTFRNRIHNATNIDKGFAASMQTGCSNNDKRDDFKFSPLDRTDNKFDTVYFQMLLQNKGLLQSDQELYLRDGDVSNFRVQTYATHTETFFADFKHSMQKMGNITSLDGSPFSVRKKTCSRTIH